MMGGDPSMASRSLPEGSLPFERGIVGVVLAGGFSRRMGRDKATLPWRGDTLAGHAHARLLAVCPEVLVSDRGRGVVGGARSIQDGAGSGPAAGLLGAAAVAPESGFLALACDLPAVPVSLLAELVELAATGADLVFPITPRGPEPLAGFYGPAALAVLATAVARGELALHPLMENPALRVIRLEGTRLARHGDPTVVFANANTPEDWRFLGG